MVSQGEAMPAARRAMRMKNDKYAQYFTTRALATSVQTGSSYMSLQSLAHVEE